VKRRSRQLGQRVRPGLITAANAIEPRQTHGAGPGQAKAVARCPCRDVNVGRGGMRVKRRSRGQRSAVSRRRGGASRHVGWPGDANPGTSGAFLAPRRIAAPAPAGRGLRFSKVGRHRTFQTVRTLEPGFCRGLRRHSQKCIASTDEPAQSSFARPRSFLEKDRRDFAVSRRILEPSVGRLGRRVFGATCARAISSFSRARASARLASCVRCTRDVMINTPSCVARLPANARRRRRTSAGSERDWPTSKRSWTAVETLLTFWPPGPEARTKVIVSSESGMNIRKCHFQNSP